MKVLMINSVCGIRSTGRICTDLATALEEKGHVVRIAYGRESVPAEYKKYAVRIGSDAGVKMHGLKARLFDASGFGSKKATEEFVKWVKEYDPDVIHLHNLHGYYINIEVLFDYLRTCGKRIIWTLHDCWAFTGHSAYCDAVDCEKWKTGCYDCPLLRNYPVSYSDRSKSNWNKKRKCMTGIPDMTLVTPSEWLARLTGESFLKDYPVKVINNGIDTSQFYPLESDIKDKLGISDKKMLLGVATTWSDMKGWQDYLKLADMLDERYRIVMLGLTEKQIESLPQNIIGVERTNNIKELVMMYSAADVLLNLSYCESYGMTNIEAQQCGTPVITYAAGGCVETAGPESVIVEKGNVESVVRALDKVKPVKQFTGAVDKTDFVDRSQLES